MKSRSHRLPTSDPSITDDWVDGSWTVDCVCGVNFDDGEEMVNCDECGVWVHTRCSRYVKSEKSFACDKCKTKNNARNDSEETEVAQLLVELPTKTLRMDNPYPVAAAAAAGVAVGHPSRPFRLWTDIPMEERVHVQGIPGGEPALFGGLSSVFTPDLWKCTGYVPKKFNFQYREFPCWDKEDDEQQQQQHEVNNSKIEEENVDKGAGVLFSLSKENVLAAPVTSLIGMKRQVDQGRRDKLAPSKDTNKWEGENIEARCPQNSIKKDTTLLRPFVIHSGKRQKEDSGTSKDRSGKKKVRVIDRDGDSKKRAPQASKTASTLSSDAKYEDGGLKVAKTDTRIIKTDTRLIKNADLRDSLLKFPLPGSHLVVENNIDKPKDYLASCEHQTSEAPTSDASSHKVLIGARPTEEKAEHQVSARIESSFNTDDVMAPLVEHKDPGKEEVVGVVNSKNNEGDSSGCVGVDHHNSEPHEDFSTAVAEGEDNQNCQEPLADLGPSSLELGAKLKTEADLHNSGRIFNAESSTLSDVKVDVTRLLAQHSGASADHLSVNDKMNDMALISSHFIDLKVQGVGSGIEAVSNCQTDTGNEFPYNPCQPDRQVEGSEGSTTVEKSSLELNHDLRTAEEPSKLSSTTVIPPAPPSQRKMTTSSSAPLNFVISTSSVSDNCKPLSAENHNPFMKRGMSDCSVGKKKDNGSTGMVRSEDRHELSRKTLKEHSKSSVSSGLNASHSRKILHASDSKKFLSDSKDPVLNSSSKASSAQNIGVALGSGEPSSSLQTQCVSHVQNKMSASGLPHRGEKVNQSNSQSATRVNHTALMHPPAPSNSPATLSDEELALLLHQELNSSPRVPRVPRMRHTGSLPQLGSPTATSMLIKRTSNSGGRDHTVVGRRKNKDLPKDRSRSSREIDDEAKMDRLPPSPDPRRHDSACTADAFAKREADGVCTKGVHAVKKSALSVSTATVGSGPSSSTEANEHNLSAMRNSLRNASDDDTGTTGGPTPTRRTLPGLIAEIMSKGKRMTYEELCNAVLPHWPNLRKHNGERYAYSSHSQAVLDCLRNRHEWAQLVDRGPKTNAGRKRRKLDAEAPGFESDDNEYGKDTTVKEKEKSFESHREEFPKGKRKARKRRRLALQGRGIKDVRRRRKADILSDDDAASFSSSSEESIFSDDEMQGGGTCPVRSDASTGSDEMAAMS